MTLKDLNPFLSKSKIFKITVNVILPTYLEADNKDSKKGLLKDEIIAQLEKSGQSIELSMRIV